MQSIQIYILLNILSLSVQKHTLKFDIKLQLEKSLCCNYLFQCLLKGKNGIKLLSTLYKRFIYNIVQIFHSEFS